MDRNSHSPQKDSGPPIADRGPAPFAADIVTAARQNQNFRTAFWTGEHLQMTLMSLPLRGEIGLEMHPDIDQFIRVESGRAFVLLGDRPENMTFQRCLNPGWGVFVPAGAWHNIRNMGNGPLKLSSLYAPPRHPRGTVHPTKADAGKD